MTTSILIGDALAMLKGLIPIAGCFRLCRRCPFPLLQYGQGHEQST